MPNLRSCREKFADWEQSRCILILSSPIQLCLPLGFQGDKSKEQCFGLVPHGLALAPLGEKLVAFW
jgi:hypothetical protein